MLDNLQAMLQFLETYATPLVIALGFLVTFIVALPTLNLQRRNKSLEYSFTKNPDYLHSKIILEKVFHDWHGRPAKPIPRDIIRQRNKEYIKKRSGRKTDDTLGHDLYEHLRFVLGFWENMALAIEYDIAEEDTAYAMTASNLVSFYIIYGDFIAGEQAASALDRKYYFLSELASRWQQRLEQDRLYVAGKSSSGLFKFRRRNRKGWRI